MDDDRDQQLLESVQKLTELQLHTLMKVTQLQAEVLASKNLFLTILQKQGFDAAVLNQEYTEIFGKLDDRLADAVKSWLDEKDIASPSADDPWWDKPAR